MNLKDQAKTKIIVKAKNLKSNVEIIESNIQNQAVYRNERAKSYCSQRRDYESHQREELKSETRRDKVKYLIKTKISKNDFRH